MRRKSLYAFRYRRWDLEGGHSEIDLHVEALDQPKAEAKADAEYREFLNDRQRLPWHVLRRDLVSVGEG